MKDSRTVLTLLLNGNILLPFSLAFEFLTSLCFLAYSLIFHPADSLSAYPKTEDAVTINKQINWILASLGLASAALSVVMLHSTTTVFAACTASIDCGGTPLQCSCPGSGTCTATTNCVTCTCQGEPPPLPHCCIAGGDT